MAGIIVNIEGKDINIISTEIRQEEKDFPTPCIILRFASYIDEKRGDSYEVMLTGVAKTEFYLRWNNHREVYIELCRQQGWDESIVPEDMDDEVTQ